MSHKILNMEQRMKQKEHKKRAVNRLLINIGGTDTEIGVKIYSLYQKVKKPTAVKINARNNKLLKRIKKVIAKGGE